MDEGDWNVVASYLVALTVIAISASLVMVRNSRRRRQQAFDGDLHLPLEDETLDAEVDDLEEDVDDLVPGGNDDGADHSNMTQKQMNKAVRKQQKREFKQARAEAIRQGELRKKEMEAARAEREAAREEEHMMRDEERRKEEHKRLVQEERVYSQWKGKISVQARGGGPEGESDANADSVRDRIEAFVKMHKVVTLEETAAEVSLGPRKTKTILEGLQKSGRVPGVFDDRGKFVYVTAQELELIAEFIENKGRIDVRELAKECNQLLKL